MPGARFVELPGEIHHPAFSDRDAALQVIQEFLTGARPPLESGRVLLTVLFTDIVGSTELAAKMGNRAWNELLGAHNARVRAELDRHQGNEIDTAGDGFFATFDGPARALRCAKAAVEAVRPLGLDLRAGVHTGEVETIAEKVRGIAVIIGARIAAQAGPSEVLVSRTVIDLVGGSGLRFEDAGEHELKGVPERWRLYRVISG
jgi:class 3 adenylate cyclase